MNFKFTDHKITLDGMEVGRLVPSEDRSYTKIFLAVDDPIKPKWAVLRKTFKREVDAKLFLVTNIDSILNRFPLYPIAK